MRLKKLCGQRSQHALELSVGHLADMHAATVSIAISQSRLSSACFEAACHRFKMSKLISRLSKQRVLTIVDLQSRLSKCGMVSNFELMMMYEDHEDRLKVIESELIKAATAKWTCETGISSAGHAAYKQIGDRIGLEPEDVKAAVDGLFRVVAKHLKENKNDGSFKIPGMLDLKVKVKQPSKRGAMMKTKVIARPLCGFKRMCGAWKWPSCVPNAD